MDASARTDCDLENDEDLEFFQKSIKVHDRFGGNCDEEDEFFSDDEPDEPISCQKGGGYLKPVGGFTRCSALNSEAKLETISMLDNVRSSCSKSGHDLSLEMLNLKSDEAGLGNPLEGVFLGKSILSSSPPFGDPLSEMDILDSALSLLDDKTCQKFREEGLFDGLVVDKNVLSLKDEMKATEKDVGCHEAELDLVTSSDWQTPEPYYHTLESPENLGKPALELMPEDVSKQDVYPSVPSEPLDPILSCQIKKTRQSKSVNSSRKQLNDSDSLDSKGSVGREFPPNNLSLDDLVRYINGESLKKVCNRKNQPTALPQTTTVNTKKLKKQPLKKHDVVTTSKARVSPATNRLRKTTKNPGHAGVVGPGEFTEDSSSPQEVFCDVDVIPNRSAATTGMTASVKEETAFASDAEHEDESAGQEEFVAVLHKKRVKGRREPHLKQDMLSACTVSPQTKVAGRQPGSASARIDKDLGASTMSVFSVSSRSYRSDTSGGSVASKRDSLSSLDESPPLPAAYDSSAFGSSTGNQEHAGVSPFRPSFSKFSAGNSYASALLQNMPKLSVTGSPEVSHTETGTVEGAAFSSPLNSEAESEMLLSPPQSEADTGFSSSSSLSPDEIHVSLASDSAVMLSKVNQVVDSESSMLKCTADDVHYEILEQPREECIVQDSVSCCVTNIDFPLTRISELSGRTDKTQLNAGESSLACSSRDLSCADAPSKNAPVIFDTRIRAVAHKTSNSDIVFLFDAEDSVADASSNVGNYVPVDDIDGITFTSSPDSMPLETSALEKASSNYIAALDASSDTRTIGECGSFDLTDKPVFDPRWGIRVTGDQSSCNEHIARDSEHERPPVNGRKLVEQSVAEVLYSAPCGGFDLLAAQKFISQAFRSVLKRERECPGQVVRL